MTSFGFATLGVLALYVALFFLASGWAARAAGLDIAQGKADRMLPGTVAILNQDMADVETASIQGTPTFFINEKPLAQLGVEELKEVVRREVKAL